MSQFGKRGGGPHFSKMSEIQKRFFQTYHFSDKNIFLDQHFFSDIYSAKQFFGANSFFGFQILLDSKLFLAKDFGWPEYESLSKLNTFDISLVPK